MSATRPSQNTTISTRKHTLFDADVATTPARLNLFCSTNHLTVHPQKNIIKKMSSGNHRELQGYSISV